MKPRRRAESAEKRQHPRRRLTGLARYESVSSRSGSYPEVPMNILDISRSGVRFMAPEPPQSSVGLRILLHQQRETVELKVSGRPVWYGRAKSSAGRYYQVAVAFDSMDERAQQALLRILQAG